MQNQHKVPYVIDIETNGLLEHLLDYSSFPYKLTPEATTWVVVVKNLVTGEIHKATKENITKAWLQDVLKDCTHLIAHNGIKFDFIYLKLANLLDYKIGWFGEYDELFGRKVTILDTLIISRLFYPDRPEGHSLEAWGNKLGFHKTDFRGICIEKGYIEKNAPDNAEFQFFSEEMVDYCVRDVEVNEKILKELQEEKRNYNKWDNAIKMEHKLADLAIRREHLGFWFDKEKAIHLVEDLTAKMTEIQNKIEPKLPKKNMTKGDLEKYTPPKKQFKQNGTLTTHMEKFVEKIDAEIYTQDGKTYLLFEEQEFELPYYAPVKTITDASIEDYDHVKHYLLDLGWEPTEWKYRDLTKDAAKKNIPYKKRVEALDRWIEETEAGKYKHHRYKLAEIKNINEFYEKTKEKLQDDKPVLVPTSPQLKVGVKKELCPNLSEIKDEDNFAEDYTYWLTYRHRRSCIAGGDIEELDLYTERPKSGYLADYREQDGRIPTPAIEIGAATSRYRHKTVVNIPRVGSIYGYEMRSLFGAGEGFVQLGFDFSSLENRIQGHYVKPYPQGEELAQTMIAEKPNDLHTVNSVKLNISRDDTKSLNYSIIYGSQPPKIASMLNITQQEAEGIYNDFWEAMPALKELKNALNRFWEKTGKKYIVALDGRKVYSRSKHSLLNFLFQSGGVLCTKYTDVFLFEELEKEGYCIDPFEDKPEICDMIDYHDECQISVIPNLLVFKSFDTEEQAKEFAVENNTSEPLPSKEGGYYVALESDVSKAIRNAIRRTEKQLKLNVSLGFEYFVGRNWADCH